MDGGIVPVSELPLRSLLIGEKLIQKETHTGSLPVAVKVLKELCH